MGVGQSKAVASPHLQEEIRSQTEERDILRYQPGESIFREGDAGGDIYLIEFGEVEVYRQSDEDQVEVGLATMKKGELIGLFTCLNDSARTASVRAKGAVRCRVIQHERIRKALGTLPKWFTIILKEYGVRLREVEDQLLNYAVSQEKNRHKVFSPVIEGRFVCHAIASLSQIVKMVVEGQEFVEVDRLLQLVGETLGLTQGRIVEIFEVLRDAGLLLVQIEPDHKKKVIPISNCEQLVDFPKFVHLAKDGKSKKMAHFRWSGKTIKIGRALCKYAQARGLATASVIGVMHGELVQSLEKLTGTSFDEKFIGPLLDFRLIKQDSEDGDDRTYQFHPNQLGRTLAHIVAYQRLSAL